MSDTSRNKIVALPRTKFGKGAARSIRREHNIPAVMYGHGTSRRQPAANSGSTESNAEHGVREGLTVQETLGKDAQQEAKQCDDSHV